jgi:putative methylase
VVNVDRKHLAIALSRIPDPPDPKTIQEQVRTPGDLAADFLVHAHKNGDLQDKNLVDLGAGTGVLGIGALLLGARSVLGIESDPTLVPLAEEAAQAHRVQDAYRILQADVARITPQEVQESALETPLHSVIMNPPFGADRTSRAQGGDRVFLSLAFRLAPVVYSMHLAHTTRFLEAYARDAQYQAEVLESVEFPLPARFAHHRQAKATRSVVFMRFSRD